MKIIRLFLFLRLVFGIKIPKHIQKEILIRILKFYKESENCYCVNESAYSLFSFFTQYHDFDYYVPVFSCNNAIEHFNGHRGLFWWDIGIYNQIHVVEKNIFPRVMFINWCIGQLSK